MKLPKLKLAKATREVYECLHLANCEKGSSASTLYGLCVDAKNALEDAATLLRLKEHENRTSESEDES